MFVYEIFHLGLWQPWEEEAEKEPQPYNAHNANHSCVVFTSAWFSHQPGIVETPITISTLPLTSSEPLLAAARHRAD